MQVTVAQTRLRRCTVADVRLTAFCTAVWDTAAKTAQALTAKRRDTDAHREQLARKMALLVAEDTAAENGFADAVKQARAFLEIAGDGGGVQLVGDGFSVGRAVITTAGITTTSRPVYGGEKLVHDPASGITVPLSPGMAGRVGSGELLALTETESAKYFDSGEFTVPDDLADRLESQRQRYAQEQAQAERAARAAHVAAHPDVAVIGG